MTKPLINPHPEVAALADHCFRAGVNVPDVLRRAKVAPSTWMRWRRGMSHSSSTMFALRAALAEIIKENESHAQAD
jgi:hypothetical protein